MILRDLNELANSSRENYRTQFINEDFKLTRDFKELFASVLKSRNAEIRYLDHSAEISISSGNKIFCPNQWFYISTFVVDYTMELIKYKEKLEQISQIDNYSITGFWDKIKSLKGKDIDQQFPEIKEAIYNFFEEEQQSAEYLCRFITDYEWWYGSKTVDRTDFHVSPILHLLGLVNVSQSYVAYIVFYMASNDQLLESALRLQEQEFRHNTNTAGENLIVYGAPGTGKSRYLEDNFSNTTRVVFHSEYSYFDFVGSYKPVPLYKPISLNMGVAEPMQLYRINGDEFQRGEPVIDYQFVAGPFINVLIKAVLNPESKYTLLIEEVNRANAPSVFGDIFQLLDRKSDGRSQYKISPNEDLKNYLSSIQNVRFIFEEGLFIPGNMNIVATMNSADQGVYVLDSAFKRRWKFKYMAIKESGFSHENSLVRYAGVDYKWRILLTAINNKLKNLDVNEDRLIGPYFISPEEIGDTSSFASKLLIYLWDDVARYKRTELFSEGIRTYSELVSAYYNNLDVLEIRSDLEELLEQEVEALEEEVELIQEDISVE
ncbi:AAA family ATPase [Alkalihalobacillus sp. BA299]|uniref:AAA family ATPase n=1 Tax=Alkalihalobacillus sp. BA299 TaxID=2815938 RepID=UPI001AD96E17|nr:AAA family ATPase [Alkalihalobacillus sp. BA299]